ncbi:23S rRNA (adenine(2030)-N(6))-methyltransferase RlmJ [Marinobacterium jannaschii]|uniref:23S rRNA (adenine(2030)-N(6))-methyltransferase RlmJ n=1 Tax=Marinobacterium jannaschii TaxID=64970 RepID=UPI0004890F6B|nr:23S rRNA (adenine(2030)-N(6))-methyltransferase RlmJ [Marinobacterium jannaschii]
MLSYLHGFHAGNFADVHKHSILCLLMQALNRKNKPWSYLETHSGSALYDLQGERALKTAEFKGGIERLWQQPVSELLQPYLKAVQAVNADDSLRFYPGSPEIMRHFMRDNDKAALMELHPAEAEKLKRLFRMQPGAAVHSRDGYEGVGALLPPKPNRGLVLIDPSFEVKSEYAAVVRFLTRAHARWSNGSYAIWYPLLAANGHAHMKQKLKQSGIRNILCSELQVASPDSKGMYGSGMLIINPPWQLDQQLETLLPEVSQLLSSEGRVELNWLVGE